VTISKERNM